MNGGLEFLMDGWIDGEIDRWMDKRTDGPMMDGRIDR